MWWPNPSTTAWAINCEIFTTPSTCTGKTTERRRLGRQRAEAMGRQRFVAPYMWGIIAAGATILLFSLYRLPLVRLDLPFLILALLVIAVSSSVVIRIPLVSGGITVSARHYELAGSRAPSYSTQPSWPVQRSSPFGRCAHASGLSSSCRARGTPEALSAQSGSWRSHSTRPIQA